MLPSPPSERSEGALKPDAAEPRGWVLFDAGCGVCSRWVPFWGPTLARLGLAVAPLQAPWVAARLGLAPDALLTDIRLLLRDGRQFAGTDAYRYVMRRLAWAYPLHVLSVTPGPRWIFDRTYRAFANRRRRISAGCRLEPPKPVAPGPPAAGAVLTPGRRPFLTADWRYLVMVNYAVDPSLVEPLVPAGTVLDRWQGRTFVSVVGFRFLRTRVLGVPVPFHRDFDEVNLRFYVRREGPGREVRRGVVFVRELVARPAVAILARLAYNEPYRVVPMRSVAPATPVEAPGRLAYEWRGRAGWEGLTATAIGTPAVPPPDSEATFITQHHWGYTRQRDGRTVEYRVDHPPWRVWTATSAVLTADMTRLYGPVFASALSGPPASALIAEGSSVIVSTPRRLELATAPVPGRSPTATPP
jgi:uncharacterized protein YqjF (DUF2071 family)/predicted DCC family thiol-disulfide oxidoreductase YuxK